VKRVGIALLGCGTVGRGFVELVAREQARISARFGVELAIHRILVRDLDKARPGVDHDLMTTSAVEVLDAGCDIVVELVGGVHCAGAYIRRAIANGSDIVTANKALLSAAGPELFDAAGRRGVTIGFEASVCGGIPVVRALRHGLAGDEIESIRGILNGTCNYILTRMDEDGLDFAEALAMAQARGLAEADPALDVDGEDASQKLEILVALGFDDSAVRRTVRGIRGLTPEDIDRARRRGRVWRHVAHARRTAGGVELSIEPEELARTDVLAGIRDENNAIVIHGRAVGEMLFAGKGAGSLPTAAAVLSDVIESARAA
jgi:homoserine dehydrogenase